MIDPAHSGAQLARDIPPPLELEWSVRQDGEVSYPLIAGGYVFYAANRADRHATPSINAVDARTGELLWNFSSDPGNLSAPAHLAYDRGLLFVADTAGHVIALDAPTGRVVWSVTLDADIPISIAASVPVAVGGGVYVTVSAADGIQLYALNGQYGSVAYRVSALQGYPTFGDDWIFTTSGCYETHGVDARTGDAKVHYQGECGGSGGERSAFWGGYVFTADGAGEDAVGVIDARFGLFYTELKSPGIAWPMTFGTTPLAIDTLDVPPSDTPGGLVGYDSSLTTGNLLVPITEGGWPVLPAIVTAAHVYVLVAENATSPATLLALDPALGKVTWAGTTQQVPEDPGNVHTGFGPLPGMAAGNGYVAIGWNRTIAVFGPAAEH